MEVAQEFGNESGFAKSLICLADSLAHTTTAGTADRFLR
jgi:hypothetical protein